MKVPANFTSKLLQRPNGTFYIAMPRDDVRAFYRKLPNNAHSSSPRSERTYVIVKVKIEWEGLVFDD